VSHELRTPIANLLGVLELLTHPGVPPEARHGLGRRAEVNGRMVRALLDDLLDLAKVEAGELELNLSAVDVSAAAREVVESFEHEARRKGLRLESVVDSAAVAWADHLRVRQVLTNLVGNALKFTDRGEVRVCTGLDGSRDAVNVDVLDTGIGLSAEQALALFEPFQQADASIASRYGGTGIGLSLSRRLAQRMGGDVRLVESAPGLGTTFLLSLPIAIAIAVDACAG